jgi:hypothetical protein
MIFPTADHNVNFTQLSKKISCEFHETAMSWKGIINRQIIGEGLTYFGGAVILFTFFEQNFLSLIHINGASMSPLLNPGGNEKGILNHNIFE